MQAGLVTTEAVKLYEATIQKMVDKVDRQGNCQTIVWRYDKSVRKKLEEETRLAVKERRKPAVEKLVHSKVEKLWAGAYNDWRKTVPNERTGKDRP